MAESDHILRTSDGYKYLLCENYETRYKSTMTRHVLSTHMKEDSGITIVLCKKLCVRKSQYHCGCGCDRIFDRKNRLILHVKSKDEVAKNIRNPIKCSTTEANENTVGNNVDTCFSKDSTVVDDKVDETATDNQLPDGDLVDLVIRKTVDETKVGLVK